MTQRLAMGLEYHGGHFFGWQIQAQEPTVQGVVEAGLAKVADHPVRVHTAGRTDAGVHALNQVIHFDSDAPRDHRAWLLGLNRYLPPWATATWVRDVPDEFNARFSALARSYRYRILNRTVPPALQTGRMAWIRQSLDVESMQSAAQVLLGEHDFSSFRAAGCQANHPVRDLHAITVERRCHEVTINVTANAFLYHMVRNIAGALIRVGKGELDADGLAQLLALKDRTQAPPTAPPDGLYFLGPRYAAGYGLPFLSADQTSLDPAILSDPNEK